MTSYMNARSVVLPLIASLALGCWSDSRAGMAAGPYIVWANLAQSQEPRPTVALHNYLESQRGDEFCGDTAQGWIIYTHTRPPGMSDQLISEALLDQSASAKKRLVRLIKSFKDADVHGGIDGIVAFTPRNGAHMISIDAHGKIAESALIKDVGNAAEVIKSFCKVYPENFRQ